MNSTDNTATNSENSNVWIIDDDRSIRWVLEKALQQAGIQNESFCDGLSAQQALEKARPDVIISDIRMPNLDGLELLKDIHARYPELPVIITTAHSDLESAVASYQGGAFEYLPKPFDIDEAIAVTHRALAFAQEQKPQQAFDNADSDTEIIGSAPVMQEVFRAIGRLSNSNMTVLINGESGTGKELVAKALHNHSPRSKAAFIALNMAAIPRELMESELFGHEKGAFTGATQRREGRFEQADGGTLFLDEIGDMPADTQTRLLRVLADGEFYRVGGHTSIKVDVRIIAATHQELEQLVEHKRFREDLFHRLNVIRIHLPRLSERSEDIPALAQHFLQRAAKELEVEPKILLPDTAAFLRDLSWEGNVRQLENTCRWLTVMAAGREIHTNDLPQELLQANPDGKATSNAPWHELLRHWAERELRAGGKDLLGVALPQFEKAMIQATLAHTHGRRRDASELLGWGRNTLTRKIKDLKLDSPEPIDSPERIDRP